MLNNILNFCDEINKKYQNIKVFKNFIVEKFLKLKKENRRKINHLAE